MRREQGEWHGTHNDQAGHEGSEEGAEKSDAGSSDEGGTIGQERNAATVDVGQDRQGDAGGSIG